MVTDGLHFETVGLDKTCRLQKIALEWC